MTDLVGRYEQGEINELLIWQQPQPLVFAEDAYRAAPARATLDAWRGGVRATADLMAAYARRSATTRAFDLGPPMHVVSRRGHGAGREAQPGVQACLLALRARARGGVDGASRRGGAEGVDGGLGFYDWLPH